MTVLITEYTLFSLIALLIESDQTTVISISKCYEGSNHDGIQKRTVDLSDSTTSSPYQQSR